MALSIGASSIDAAAAELGALLKAKPPTSLRETLALLQQAFTYDMPVLNLLALAHAKKLSIVSIHLHAQRAGPQLLTSPNPSVSQRRTRLF